MTRRTRFLAILSAFVFLTAFAPPVSADDGWHCHACEMCYSPTPFCSACGTMTLNAISGCCGMGNGEAYCVPDYGGFAVNCEGGSKSCQCNMEGGGCQTLPIVSGG